MPAIVIPAFIAGIYLNGSIWARGLALIGSDRVPSPA
jgi:hypothetical protein